MVASGEQLGARLSRVVCQDAPRTPVSAVAPSEAEREQLLPLTSLRFVAAGMIVLAHTRGTFGFPSDWGEPFNLWQGVTFFFVLSGFILAYAYPTLDAAGTRRFLVARFARLWPAHAAMFAVVAITIILGLRSTVIGETVPGALANLTMVHAWVPFPGSYFSFNGVSWSISTEFAFYLLFPWLVQNWRRTWLPKLLLSLVAVGVLTGIANLMGLPMSRYGQTGPDFPGLLSVNPLGQLYIFILGMVACLAWQRFAVGVQLGLLCGTLLELAALGLAGWTLYDPITLPMVVVAAAPWIDRAVFTWMPGIPSVCMSFPIVVVVMALRQGLVSRILSLPAFVLLGEISYALYLVHVFVAAFMHRAGSFFGQPDAVVHFGVYWLTSLLVAWALWRSVERPVRRSIRAWWSRYERENPDRHWGMIGAMLAAALALVLALQISTLR